MTELSKREMRIAIAKDVLKQLRAEVYIARGVYFMARGTPLYGNQEGLASMNGAQVQKSVKALTQCDVCAIGAAIISGIRLYDGVAGKRFDPNDGSVSWAGQRFFTERQLDLMEDFFEVTGSFLSGELEKKMDDMPHKKRMKIVFSSIAKNDGRVVKNDILNRFKKARVA